jgi:hypothetical protein
VFKFILGLALLSTGFSAFARYPDGQCAPTETKLIFESRIVFGKRVQLNSPMFCANGLYYAILGFDDREAHADHTSGLCGLYQVGAAVTYDARTVDHELLANFDEKGNFNGVMDFNIAEGNEIYAVKSITCQMP